MKFSTKIIVAVATAAALSAPLTTHAFTTTSRLVGRIQTRHVPFGLIHGPAPLFATTLPSEQQQQQQQQQQHNPVDDEVQRLKAMAAKLRQEASELEAEQAALRAQAVERAFDKFDTNQDGELDMQELKAALEKTFKLDLPEERVQALLRDFDKSGDNKIQREEFVSIEQFRNRLGVMAQEERQKELQATKVAQQQAEVAKLIESQLELINDKPPSTTDKIVSVLPYLFPLMDGVLFGQFLLSGNESNPLVAALAILYTVYRAIPFSGFLSFFALSAFSGNLSINRLVRFNMQQAIVLDVALFVPGLIAALTGAASSALGYSIPPMLAELSSDALFVTLLAILGYATVSSLLGVTPDKIPLVSQYVNDRLPTADMINFIDPTTGQPILKKNQQKDEESDKKED
jgi:Chloroplast import apparatus Tic20-like/EF-hand domain pair